MININKKPPLLIATTNKGKQKEIRELLKNLPFTIFTPGELGLTLEVMEDGANYAENASRKVEAFCQAGSMLTLADDTGLEVDQLDGRPGLHSARYSDLPGATDADRRRKMLAELEGKPHPWLAHFHCCVAVAAPGVRTMLFDGDVFGEIIESESGEHGFGYDRIFYLPAVGKTLAELDQVEKNKFSHRAVAVQKAVPYLLKLNRKSETNGL